MNIDSKIQIVKLPSVKVYRLTHIENIPHILQNGITHKNSPNRNLNYVNIGDVSLIETRANKTVFVHNGDLSSKESKSIILGDFIPFYFGVRMPMLYVTQHGGNFVLKPTTPENIVYVVCSLEALINDHEEFYFCDGHAIDIMTMFYDKSKIKELDDIIDWNAIKSAYWGGLENLDLKRKKQAEFLVFGDIKPIHIVGIGCYNETAKTRLLSMGVNSNWIKIIPNAYY